MKVLLDAHTLIWAIDDPSNLGSKAIKTIEDPENQLLISTGTVWEISIKCGLNKMSLSHSFGLWMRRAIDDLDLTPLSISVEHAERQASLPFYHRDPFDRLLAAQALVESIDLVSNDGIFDQYGAGRIWS